MFYTFPYTPTVSDVAGNPHEIDIQLAKGVIHQVDILFQDGCNHETFVQIFEGRSQIWPTNVGQAFRGNATVVSFREYYQPTGPPTRLTAYVWSTLSSDWAEVVIQLGLLPKRILQPLSFDELLAAAAGIE